MAYVKSILAGLVASVVTLAALYAVGLLVAFGLKHKYDASLHQGDSFFVEWHFHFWPILFAALVTFALGFYWQLRRSAHLPGTHN